MYIKRANKGFSLLELMITTALLSIVFSATFFIIFYSQRSIKHSMTEVRLSSEARQTYQQISRVVYQARDFTIKNSGNIVEFNVPLNTAMDMVQKSITYSNNVLLLDPDLATDDDEIILCQHVQPLPSPNNTVFVSQNGGEALQMSFLIFETNNMHNLNKNLPVTGLIKLRNSL